MHPDFRDIKICVRRGEVCILKSMKTQHVKQAAHHTA